MKSFRMIAQPLYSGQTDWTSSQKWKVSHACGTYLGNGFTDSHPDRTPYSCTGMKKVVRQRLFCMTEKERRPSGMPEKIQEGPNGSMVLHRDGFDEESNDIFRASWSLIMNLFESNSYDEVEKSGPFRIEFWVTLIFRGVALFVILPVWILLGLATAGILWPPQVREYLFAQKETAMSRAEIERAKLEQLRDIQGDIKGLKIDIRKEMASDRDEMIRLKDEVEAVQSQVLSDLQQVKELMTTLLDLGGIQES